MKQQKSFYLKQVSYRNSSQKQSFIQGVLEEQKSNSQNRILVQRRQTPIIPMQISSPNAKQKKTHTQHVAQSYERKLLLPILGSPPEMTKFKSLEGLNCQQQQQRQASPKRFKSDDIVERPDLKNRISHHCQLESVQKIRMSSNYSPNTKIDESREILLHKIQSNQNKKIIMRTEPDDPYRLQSAYQKQKDHQLNDNYKLPIYDDQSSFFSDFKSDFKDTQKNQKQISQHTKDKILDLLFLSTGELKKKFSEEQQHQNSKLTNRSIQNRLKLPKNSKNKFPQDFFNVLLGLNSQQF